MPAVDLSAEAIDRRAMLRARAVPTAERMRAKAARLRKRAGRAPLGSNQRRKLTLRADDCEAHAEQLVAQVAA